MSPSVPNTTACAPCSLMANVLRATRIGASPTPSDVNLQLNVNAQGRLRTPEEFGNIIVKAGPEGQITRLRDVARIEMGAADYTLRSLLDGQPAVAIAVKSTCAVRSDRPGQRKGSSCTRCR